MSAAVEIDVPAERAFEFVQAEFGVSATLLGNARRRAGLVRPRALFAWVLRQGKVSYPRIGRALNVDPQAAASLARVAQDLRTIDPEFAQRCDRFPAFVRGECQ